MIHYFVFVLIMLFFGALGGTARGAYERLTSKLNYDPNKDLTVIQRKRQRNYWFQHIILGMAGGACAVFLTLLLSKYSLNIKDLQSILLFSTLSTLGGVVSKRCLPALSDKVFEKLEGDLKRAEGKVVKASEKLIDVENKMSIVTEQLTYHQLINEANKALSELDPLFVKSVIECLEKEKVNHGLDRQYIIKLGRLYRRLADIYLKNGEKDNFFTNIDKGINTLYKFIELQKAQINQNEENYNAIGTAYFNMSCYNVLKSRQNSDNSVKEKLLCTAKENLEIALQCAPHLKPAIKEDPDLREIDLYK